MNGAVDLGNQFVPLVICGAGICPFFDQACIVHIAFVLVADCVRLCCYWVAPVDCKSPMESHTERTHVYFCPPSVLYNFIANWRLLLTL